MKKVMFIEGDGVGPELMTHTRRIVDLLAEVEWVKGEAGYATFQKTGTSIPQETVANAKMCDAILFCAVTSPPNIANYKSAIVTLRKELDLYANLRPVSSLPNIPLPFPQLDFAIVRENTEGMYSGIEEMRGNDEARAVRVITRKGSRRIVEFAFEYAKKRGFSKVIVVHKANVLRMTDGLFLSVAREVAARHPEIECSDGIVDSVAMRLVKSPKDFDKCVIVTTNLFGDILSDEASALIGGLGVAPSGSYGEKVALFEPVHGSAPKYAGQDVVNPTGMLLSTAMMLEHIGEIKAGEKLREAVKKCYEQGIKTKDVGGSAKTSEVVEKVVSLIN